jgi:hypothetical protein
MPTYRNITTRRNFMIKSIIGTASAFTIVPRHVVGASNQLAPNDKLNIACIGVGGRGYHVARNIT